MSPEDERKSTRESETIKQRVEEYLSNPDYYTGHNMAFNDLYNRIINMNTIKAITHKMDFDSNTNFGDQLHTFSTQLQLVESKIKRDFKNIPGYGGGYGYLQCELDELHKVLFREAIFDDGLNDAIGHADAEIKFGNFITKLHNDILHRNLEAKRK